MNLLSKIRLQKGDTVIVRTGKDKGKTGKVISTHPKLNAVTVDGINVYKRHVKPNRTHPQGDIVSITKPIDVSKVGIYDATTKKAARIAYKVSKEGRKTRVYAGTTREIK